MRYMKLLFIVSTIIVFAFGCSVKPNVHSDFDPNQDFQQYQYFSWTSDNPMIVQGDYTVSPFTGKRVMDAVIKTLEAKGYTFTSNKEQSDFAIAFTIGARDQIKVRPESAIIHGNWRWGTQYWGPQIISINTPVEYTRGVLSIDAFDVKRKSPVWHSVGSKKLSEKQLNGDEENIDESVHLILADFPIKRP